MFNNLIESGSHRRDLARKSRFFLGTLALYGAFLACAAVASVYAYNTKLEEQTYTITLLPPPILPTIEAPPDAPHPTMPPRGGQTNQVSQRRAAVLAPNTTPHEPPPVSTARTDVRPLPPTRFIISTRDWDAPAGPAAGHAGSLGDGGANARATVHIFTEQFEDPPPATKRPTTEPTPSHPTVLKLSSLVNSKIISKPAPPYPPLARAARVEGAVPVEILIDEQGRVLSATPTGGPAMLRIAAQQAAFQARFTPTLLNGRPVKVSGVITYSFELR